MRIFPPFPHLPNSSPQRRLGIGSAAPHPGLVLLFACALTGHPVFGETAQTAPPIVISATSARITGRNAHIEMAEQKYVAWWTHPDTFLNWTAQVSTPGRYRVEMEYALPGVNNGGELSVAVGPHKLKAFPKAGTGANDFHTGSLGEIAIDSAGKLGITIRALTDSRQYVINIRSLRLVRADSPSTVADIGGHAIEPSEDQSFTLSAAQARIQGFNAVLVDDDSGDKRIGYWKDLGTSLEWTIHTPAAGKFRVELNYAQTTGDTGAKFAISIGQQTLVAKPVPGKEPGTIITGQAGEIRIAEGDNLPVVLTPISKPGLALPDFVSLVLRPEATRAPEAVDIHGRPIPQAENGFLELDAVAAEIDGEAVRLEGAEEKYLAWWNHAGRSIRWPVMWTQPGLYEIFATYSRAESTQTDQVQFPIQTEPLVTFPNEPSAKGTISLSTGGQAVTHVLQESRAWDDFRTEKLGTISVTEPGEAQIILTAKDRPGVLVMQLKSILLKPSLQPN